MQRGTIVWIWFVIFTDVLALWILNEITGLQSDGCFKRQIVLYGPHDLFYSSLTSVAQRNLTKSNVLLKQRCQSFGKQTISLIKYEKSFKYTSRLINTHLVAQSRYSTSKIMSSINTLVRRYSNSKIPLRFA